jgi:hypothetical protein
MAQDGKIGGQANTESSLKEGGDNNQRYARDILATGKGKKKIKKHT